MAEVELDRELSERIDDYLDYLAGEWGQIPELAAEWAEWDELSRMTFTVNWGVPADRLAQVRGWAEQGLLTPPQRDQYVYVLQLVAQHESTLTQLLTP